MIFVHAGYPDANSDPAGFGGQYPLHTGATVPWYRYEGKVWYGMVWYGLVANILSILVIQSHGIDKKVHEIVVKEENM